MPVVMGSLCGSRALHRAVSYKSVHTQVCFRNPQLPVDAKLFSCLLNKIKLLTGNCGSSLESPY